MREEEEGGVAGTRGCEGREGKAEKNDNCLTSHHIFSLILHSWRNGEEVEVDGDKQVEKRMTGVGWVVEEWVDEDEGTAWLKQPVRRVCLGNVIARVQKGCQMRVGHREGRSSRKRAEKRKALRVAPGVQGKVGMEALPEELPFKPVEEEVGDEGGVGGGNAHWDTTLEYQVFG